MNTNNQRTIVINYMLFSVGVWSIYIAATKTGLCFVGSNDSSFSEMQIWLEKRFKSPNFIEDRKKLSLYTQQIDEYLKGERRHFTLPMDISATSFQQSVWSILMELRYGEVVTYQDVATRIGNPTAVRAVGSAIGKNPLLIVIPCHRVSRKDGVSSGYRGPLAMKESLLTLEKESKTNL